MSYKNGKRVTKEVTKVPKVTKVLACCARSFDAQGARYIKAFRVKSAPLIKALIKRTVTGTYKAPWARKFISRKAPRRDSRFARFAFGSLLLILLVVQMQADMIIIDKIAAVVNDEIITLTDIDKSIQLYPVFRKKEQTEQEFYIGMLQDLINHKAVYLEYKDEIVLREEDYMEYQSAIIKKLGSYDELLHLLSQFDMEWTDLKSFMKEKVFYDKVLQEKFQLKISIGFREIESFYNEHYLPMQKSLQLKPRTLIEMTQLIEEQLRKDRIREKIAGWLEELTSAYTIENKLLGNNQNKE